MNASFKRRLLSYIIDFVFVSSILMIVTYFIPKGENVSILNDDINSLTEQALNNDIGLREYLKNYSYYLSEVDKSNLIYNVSNFICIFIYYIFVPLIWKGRTLGKYITKLKIVSKNDKNLNIFQLLARNIIDMGLLYLLSTIFIVQIINSYYYVYLLIIFGIIQFLLVIISIFMILYRHDKQGLQDILSRSNVVLKEVKE
jgi:uncharacterized RDD family membrane protein YckC